MTRAAVAGLATPYPLAGRLPALYAEDTFAEGFLSCLDDVLAPALSTLDCLPAYLDPWLAPPDFLHWLAGWVAAEAEPDWPLDRCREAVARAVELHGWRGTRRGLAAHVRLAFGVEPEIVENGGAAWSRTPGSPLPGSAAARLTVRVRVRGADTFPVARLRALVDAARPAHVPAVVEVVEVVEAGG